MIFGVFGLAALLILRIVQLSLDPQEYFSYATQDPSSWAYHPRSVAFVCIAVLAEAALTCFALLGNRPTNLWLRCAMSLVLLVPWAILCGILIVHAPSYVILHTLWLWALVSVVVVAGIGSAVRQLYLGFTDHDTV